MRRIHWVFFSMLLSVGVFPYTAEALLCGLPPGQDCSTKLNPPDPTRVVLSDCQIYDNPTPGTAGLGCSWDLCYSTRNSGPLPVPGNAVAYCGAGAPYGLAPGYYSQVVVDYDTDGEMDIDFRQVIGPPPPPVCPNWNSGTSTFTPANATLNAPHCAIACGGTGQTRDPWDPTPCDATCQAVSCIQIDLSTASCACPAFGSGNWNAMSPQNQAICCGTAPPPPPPPPGACTTIPTGGVGWAAHGCGEGAGHCAASEVPPLPVPPVGTTFTNLTNKMSACCGRGWGENSNAAAKMDCVEAVAPPPATPATTSFLDFYMAGAAPDDLSTGGLTFPNQLFILDAAGIPLNGFYTQTGVRCDYRHNVTGAMRTLTAQEQLAIYRNSLTSLALNFSGAGPVDVDPMCCYLAVFALERKCPETDVIGGIPLATTDMGVRRCTAAKQMKISMGVFDLCDPTLTKRGRFRMATSFAGEDPTRASIFPSDAIKIEDLVSTFYPAVFPAPPVCPAKPPFYDVPWTAGMCRLTGGENYP